MPTAYVDYLPGKLDAAAAVRLRTAIRYDACKRFSVPELQLGMFDIGVNFNRLGEWSDPIRPIVVHMQLHAFPARVRDLQTNAEEMAEALMQAMNALPVEAEYKIGVMLLTAEVGWATSIVKRNIEPTGYN